MTEVEQKMDVLAHSHSSSPSSMSPDHETTPSPTRSRQRHKRSTGHTSHNHSPQKRRSPQKHTSGGVSQVLPPGWEIVKCEEGMYYWHKKTGKTTWNFPSSEAKQYRKKQQSHTYINIRPGHKPHVITQKSDLSAKSATVDGRADSKKTAVSDSSTIPNGVNKTSHMNGMRTEGARSREGDGIMSDGKKFEDVSKKESDCSEFDGGRQEMGREFFPSAHVEVESSHDVGLSLTDSLPSSPDTHRRPLVVHNYENFPFNPKKKTRHTDGGDSPSETTTGTEAWSPVEEMSSPSSPLCQPESNASPAPFFPAPSHGANMQEQTTQSNGQTDDVFALSSKPREVQRKVTEQGDVYAVINPAWKKNVRGRPPSLSGETVSITSLEREKSETPPPLPYRPPNLDESQEQVMSQAYVDLDTDFLKKSTNRNSSTQFSNAVCYAELQIPSQPHSDEISQPQVHDDGSERDSVKRTMKQGDPLRPSGVTQRMSKNERWLKTQSAHITSTHTTRPSHLHSTTPTRDTPLLITHNERQNLTPDAMESEDLPPLPPKPGKMASDGLGNSNISENNRRLNAMHVTIRRPSEGLDPTTREKFSKEALLLRSGVTLRQGVLPPRAGKEREEQTDGRKDGSSGQSGSEEEDGLEPVSRAIKSLESRISTHDSAVLAEQTNKVDQVEAIHLVPAPVGPPSWTQHQRRLHNYEDVGDDSPPEHFHSAKISKQSMHTTTRSVGNLHMVWDDSDVRPSSDPASKKGTGQPIVSASQPCLLNMDNVFPHLVKPSRVSKEAFQLRKLRMLQHTYEDIDIPEWPSVGETPGSEMGVGDVNMPSPAARNSWLEAEKESAVTDSGTQLPKGWQRMVDEEQKTYYWHIPSGKTQYTKPTGEEIQRLSLSMDDSIQPTSDQSDHSTHSPTSPDILTSPEVKGHHFSARYLGSFPVEESDLVRGECVKVVHNCINKTRFSRQQKNKSILLVIRGMELKWMEAESGSPATIQPINRIRVWGIGLENERDFGYVARDPVTRKHKCHVFRCDMPARAVAKALLENHKTANTPSSGPPTTAGGRENEGPEKRTGSPDLPLSHERRYTQSRAFSPPSRSGENAETMSCVYIGSCEVPQAQGIDILNAAVEKLCSNRSRWINVNISIATSSIKITDTKSDRPISEHRVRFLCFLGIAKDDSFCGYILESSRRQGEKKFHFHGFKMEPNTDRLCLALHSACQARYQRVLESNPNAQKMQEKEQNDRSRSKSTSSILGRLGSFKKTRREDDSKVFTVQYLGCQQVAKPEGLEVVKGPIQQLSIPKSSVNNTPTNLVDFEVSTAGLSVTDPQKKLFSRKNFGIKYITYVVRIRNYFAFVVRESGKYQCYVFLEMSVPAATIVTTIQRMLAPEPTRKR